MAFETLHLSTAHYILDSFWIGFTYTAAVNLLAIVVAFPTACCREHCFGQTNSCLMGCWQMLVGKGSLSVIFVLVFVAFTIHFAACCVLFPAVSLLTVIMSACNQGTPIIKSVATVFQISGWLNTINPLHAVLEVCAIDKHATVGGYAVIVGCVMIVFGQVLLLVSTTDNYVRVSLQAKLKKDADELDVEDRVKNDADRLPSKVHRYGAA